MLVVVGNATGQHPRARSLLSGWLCSSQQHQQGAWSGHLVWRRQARRSPKNRETTGPQQHAAALLACSAVRIDNAPPQNQQQPLKGWLCPPLVANCSACTARAPLKAASPQDDEQRNHAIHATTTTTELRLHKVYITNQCDIICKGHPPTNF